MPLDFNNAKSIYTIGEDYDEGELKTPPVIKSLQEGDFDIYIYLMISVFLFWLTSTFALFMVEGCIFDTFNIESGLLFGTCALIILLSTIIFILGGVAQLVENVKAFTVQKI